MATVIPYKDKWRAVVRRVGYPTRTKTFELRGAAERWVREIEASMDKRTYIVPSGVRVRTLFQKFSDDVAPSRKGCRWEQVRIAKFIRTIAWVEKSIEDVDRFDIQDWRDTRLKEVSSSSVNRELNLISSIITHSMQEWGVSLRVNPVHEIKRPPKGKARKRRVQGHEEVALDTKFKFDDTVPPREGYGAVKDSIMWVFHIAVETGMRSGEILDIEDRHINLDEHWLNIVDSKNGDQRFVPLTARAEELFRKLGVGTGKIKGRVFPVNKGSFEAIWRKLRNEAGLDLWFRDTRHEGASRLAPLLQNLELSKVLGHRDPRTTLIYYNPTATELAKKIRGGG